MPLLHAIGNKPIIAAIRQASDVPQALGSPVDNLFFMGGSVKQLIDAVKRTKDAGKGAFVHVDLIRGLSSTDKETVEFIADCAGADGIVTPKSHLIKEAKRVGLYGILHLFALDSTAMENGLKLAQASVPDGIELMPGIIPKVIEQFANELTHIPIIASGLIQTKAEAAQALAAGATSLSVSSPALWSLGFDDIA
ncbi:glycerol-3-phosphate responsive antiterminator [Paenibacillus cymbidii]|uniref:glycerol-3-phosphate responsive antiterminator n=1 Tax=Paenibacillus cymbidii TaxID=1639034 RepID=UPI0010809A60|nr:glycerol-3-phosphate responsive antiterminator [Paenibacillus cymbidii]